MRRWPLFLALLTGGGVLFYTTLQGKGPSTDEIRISGIILVALLDGRELED